TESPSFVYSVAVYLIAASFTMWVLALIISRGTVRILGINKKILMPVVFLLCVVGSYLINYTYFDIKVMFVFGLIGLALTSANFPAAPFLLGVILGPMTDSNLRRGLRLSDGSLMPMFQRPICIMFLVVIVFMILGQTGLLKKMKRKRS
ncbi:MAG: transporter, partial [Spirochaetia bacterium]|nr:transporter [Spirochaetia bacterium]